MSNGVKELKKLFASRPDSFVARILSVDGSTVTMASGAGIRVVCSHVPVSQGDSVLVSGGVIQGRIKRQDELVEYHL